MTIGTVSAGATGGLWEKLREILIHEPDFKWLMVDAGHCRVHPHAAEADGGNQDMGRTKGNREIRRRMRATGHAGQRQKTNAWRRRGYQPAADFRPAQRSADSPQGKHGYRVVG